MSRPLPALLFGLMLAATAVVGGGTPAEAHSAAAVELVENTPGPPIEDAGLVADGPGIALPGAPGTAGLPWPALLGVIAAAAVGWRRPRRALAFAVVLLLALFAFEDGFHSVHHGLDKAGMASCPVSAASAHLAATAVDCLVSDTVILPTIAAAPEPGQSAAIPRLPNPEQGRAPPAATA